MKQISTIAESNNFIVLDNYNKKESNQTYQTEQQLENEFINDLVNQGYEYCKDITNNQALEKNLKEQIQKLNNIIFSDSEWQRFNDEYLNSPNDNIADKTRKIHDNHIYDFIFDTGEIKNIAILDKKNLSKNKVQVVSQFEQEGTSKNRYDVTILINGLPLIHIELKKRGVGIRNAFNQIHRYSKESFNSENSLFKYIQIFVISNGTDTRYFANTTKRNKNSYDFTMNWAKSNNETIRDLKDFTATFFEKPTLLKILIKYCVFDTDNTLLIMRPYQIAATERVLWKIKSSYNAKNHSNPESGGYIWHTTGSGKTLTSFKVSRMATELNFIEKVFFVVDRKDLDYQTMKEYQKYSPDSVNGSINTKALKENILKKENKIIVTTIQKLNHLLKNESLEIYKKPVVLIFDECHRSQFGEAQKNITKRFKHYYQFGFTGTPIFEENSQEKTDLNTTDKVFGKNLHSYVITDAIKDDKVLKFKIDYNNISADFKEAENELDEKKLQKIEKEALKHPNRIKEISKYILDNFNIKTHRSIAKNSGFNAMFAVSDIPSAKLYYEQFKELQQNSKKPLKIATIFSYEPNENQNLQGQISDESFEISAMDSTSKEFLRDVVLKDYNNTFKTTFTLNNFENYYRDVAKKIKDKEIDLLIVVGMFLTGFDAPTLNTLFVDKNLKYHGLIQAFSRTNRIYDSTKKFGNIVTFRNLEHSVEEAIKLFADGNKNIGNTSNIIIERSYNEYINGYYDDVKDCQVKGYKTVVNELETKFSDVNNIQTSKDKKEFVQLFGNYLELENVLKNYDEFTKLEAYNKIDKENPEKIKEFKEKYFINDKDIKSYQDIKILEPRYIQDCKSKYSDIWELSKEENEANNTIEDNDVIDWEDITFQIELLKSQEINLDYILLLISNFTKEGKTKEETIENIRSIIKSSIQNKAKESLIIDYINGYYDDIKNLSKDDIISHFTEFAKIELDKEEKEIIESEKLNSEKAQQYIKISLNKGFASENGTALTDTLPKMPKIGTKYRTKKRTVFEKIKDFVEKFKGI